jgi:hypothetical protein
MIKVVDNFTEGRPYREFIIGLIGSAIVAVVLFFIFTYALMLAGFMTSHPGTDLSKNISVFHAILHYWSEVSPQLAVLIATVVFSLLEYFVSKRTIGVLPRSWLYATIMAFVLGLILYLPAMQSFVYAVKADALLDSRTVSLGSVHLSMKGLFLAFCLMAIAQGAALMKRHGNLNALLWSIGSIGLLYTLLALNKVPAYPLVQGIFAAALCYRYWRQSDPRKSKLTAG